MQAGGRMPPLPPLPHAAALREIITSVSFDAIVLAHSQNIIVNLSVTRLEYSTTGQLAFIKADLSRVMQ